MEITPVQIVGLIFFAFIVVWISFLIKKNKKDLWEAIKGEDGKLQTIEMGVLVWFIFFPILLLSDLFLGLQVSGTVWYSMDGIFVALVVGDVSKKHIESKKK